MGLSDCTPLFKMSLGFDVPEDPLIVRFSTEADDDGGVVIIMEGCCTDPAGSIFFDFVITSNCGWY